jgi:hypothetical protein
VTNLASSLTIDEEHIAALDNLPTSDVRHLTLLVRLREINQASDVAQFAYRRLRHGICAHVDSAALVLKDIVVGEIEAVAVNGG